MGLGETGNLMGESQAFPWEGGASRSELNEMIACGNHTLKRDGAEQSEAERFCQRLRSVPIHSE